MSKLIGSLFLSLDGVFEAPERWHFPYVDDAMRQAIEADILGAGSFLLGRRTYDDWVAYWPSQGDSNTLAAKFNGTPKRVVSSTITQPEWEGTTVLGPDGLEGAIADLKAGERDPIAVIGSATLVRWLIDAKLLDELRLMIHPIVLGEGQKLFESLASTPLELVSSEIYGSGVANLAYRRVD